MLDESSFKLVVAVGCTAVLEGSSEAPMGLHVKAAKWLDG